LTILTLALVLAAPASAQAPPSGEQVEQASLPIQGNGCYDTFEGTRALLATHKHSAKQEAEYLPPVISEVAGIFRVVAFTLPYVIYGVVDIVAEGVKAVVPGRCQPAIQVSMELRDHRKETDGFKKRMREVCNDALYQGGFDRRHPIERGRARSVCEKRFHELFHQRMNNRAGGVELTG